MAVRSRVRVFVGVVGVVMAIVVPSVSASSSPQSLLTSMHQAIAGVEEDDFWFVDDGCFGGTRPQDPLLVTPVGGTASCSVRVGVPIVVLPAGITCWEETVAIAKEQCDEAWSDDELLTASVSVDGVEIALRFDVVTGTVTVPEDSPLGVPPGTFEFYGISESAIVRGLTPGTHVIEASFEYASGFAATQSFTITVTR
jgi:hypothetical protein